jgi:hypothetical protein
MISGHGDMETAKYDATWCIWLYIKTTRFKPIVEYG